MTVIMPFETLYRETVEKIFEEDLPGFSEAKAFCLGDGKRLRPRLLIDAAEIWGADPEAAARAAVGVELLHHYLLIHDDLMDGDELRRGMPTVHAANSARYGERAGNGIAIAIGDYVANEALNWFATASGDSAKDAALTRLAVQVTRETILGQMREYNSDSTWQVDALDDFYTYKTAAYTFRLPWLAADLLSGSDPTRRLSIEDASRELGIAYQYHDDLIEFRGEKKRSAEGGGDTARGKLTIVTRLLLDVEERLGDSSLEDVRAGRPLSLERLKELQILAGNLGVLSQVEEKINARIQKAQAILSALRLSDAPSVKMLLEFLRPSPSQ